MSQTYSAGVATAYGAALRGGYEGTYQEFCTALGNLADVLDNLENFTVEVTTLPAGSSATASYSDGVLSLGIPKGDKGDPGTPGADGEKGDPGDDGNGIVSITKTGTSGLVDTYTITYTDGTTTTFEVTNGADGEVTNIDDTLTQQGKPADAKKVGDELTDLKGDISEIDPSEKLVFTAGYYINTSGTTVNINSPTRSSEGFAYSVTDCQEGDRYLVSGVGGVSGRLWCFIDENGNNLEKAASSKTENQLIITAPENASKCIINDKSSSSSYKGIPIFYKLSSVDSDISALAEGRNLYVEETSVDGYLYTNGSIQPQTGYKEKTSDYIAVTSGEKVTIQLWATPTSTYILGVIIARYDSAKAYQTRETYTALTHEETYYKYVFTVPTGISYIRVSGRMFDDGVMMITHGDLPIAYDISVEDVKSGLGNISSALAIGNNNTYALNSGNLYVDYTAVDGFINADGTIADETAAREKTSDFIAVDNPIINIQTWLDEEKTTRFRCVYYDENKSVLGNSSDTIASVTYAQKIYTAPSGTKYIRVGANYLKTIARLMISYGRTTIAYEPNWQDVANKISALQQGGSYGLWNPLIKPASPKIAMHRGMMAEAPENTIPAFTLAGQGGAWGIETDVWETTDGYFVLSHDNDVSRMTDGTGNITEMSYAQTQEYTIDAGSNIEQYPNLKMPLLQDYLTICRRYGCVPVIEIKGITNYSAFINLIKSYGLEGSAVLAMYWDSNAFATVRTLTAMPIMIVGTSSFSTLLSYTSQYPDLWLNIIDTLATEENIKLAHSANVPIAGWTYETNSAIENAVNRGMDIVISGTIAQLT